MERSRLENAAGKDEVIGERVKDGRLNQKLCNIAFESGVMPEDWRSCDYFTVQG